VKKCPGWVVIRDRVEPAASPGMVRYPAERRHDFGPRRSRWRMVGLLSLLEAGRDVMRQQTPRPCATDRNLGRDGPVAFWQAALGSTIVFNVAPANCSPSMFRAVR
jgi:hypothetical protein